RHRARIADVDDADGQVVRGQLREVLEDLLRRLPDGVVHLRIGRKVLEVVKVRAGGGGGREKKQHKPNSHSLSVAAAASAAEALRIHHPRSPQPWVLIRRGRQSGTHGIRADVIPNVLQLLIWAKDVIERL